MKLTPAVLYTPTEYSESTVRATPSGLLSRIT